MLPYRSENIVAIATPPGNGALAIVRFSGKNLYSVYRSFSHKRPQDRKAIFSKIYHPSNNKLLDEAVIIYFKSPNSFTGEDVIEITCHGGALVSKSIILAAIDYGIRNAKPGEFSCRAYLNGKIDLLQAEGISSLISAKSQFLQDISLNHLLGHVTKNFSEIKNDSLNILSIIENELNFSEQEIDLTSISIIRDVILNIRNKLETILNNTTHGLDVALGIRVVIIGKTNSGKSSLYNAILGYDRAIVSSVPGTTRDTIESIFELEGVPVCLIDTAGIWESEKYLDRLSIEKSYSSLDEANICFLVDDVDPKLLEKSLCKNIKKDNYILIKTKSDLNNSTDSIDNNIIAVSSKLNTGINKLLTCLSTHIKSNISNYDVINPILVTRRQRGLLKRALSSIVVLIEQIDNGVETDIIASGIRGFVSILEEVLGEIPNEDIINNIFSNFCIGK